MITNCNIDGSSTFAIGALASRVESSYSIVSSFGNSHHEPLRHKRFCAANSTGSKNRESRFAIMLARSIETALFEKQIGEINMKALHKKGDVVRVYQLCPRRGLMLEGNATVMRLLDRSMEHYMVRFHGKDGKPSLGEEYERFIDRDGQTGDPQDYIKAFNKKCGIAA